MRRHNLSNLRKDRILALAKTRVSAREAASSSSSSQPTGRMMKLRQKFRNALLVGLVSFWQVLPTGAVDYYWDTDTFTTGNDALTGANLGGSGTWDTLTTSNWWNLAAPATLTTWPGANDRAIFDGAPGAVVVTAGTIANNLSFRSTGYTLSGGDIALAGANAGLYAEMGESATVSSILTGSDGLLKTGGGSVRLTNVLNSYTGATTIAGGSLIINSAAALGGTGTVLITAGNGTPSNTNVTGFTGGSLVLDGSAVGIGFTRALNLEGRGPIGNNGSALLSIGNNTVSGAVATAVSLQTPATFRNTRINSVNGTLTLSGGLNVGGTLATTITTLGGQNTTGIGNFVVNGPLTGTGTLEKAGGGTLFFSPSAITGFSGALRMNASAASGQSTVRISTPLVLGTNTGTGANSVIDLNTGFLEVRMDAPTLQSGSTPAAANVYSRSSTNSNFFVDHALGSSTVNGTLALGQFGFVANAQTTFISRNGYNMSFGAAPVVTGDNNTTITNSLAGTLTFAGNFWSNSNTTAARTMTIAGNGNTVISGNVIAAGGASFDHILTKSGAGSLTISSTGSTLDGAVNIQNGAVRVTDFRSITNNSSAIVLGNAGTTGGNLIIGGTGVVPTSGGLTTSKTITLNTTTASNSIYANQTGTDPVRLNGAITKIAAATTGNLILGGSNAADNIVNVVIPVEAPTASTGGLTKLGSGTWVLSALNTYLGATNIQSGTLKLQATAGSSNTILETATNTVVFSADGTTQSAGGRLEFTGFLNTPTTETLGALTPTSGAGNVAAISNGAATTLTFTGMGARSGNTGLNFTLPSSGAINFTAAVTGTPNGIVGGFATVGGTNFATTIGAGGAVAAPAYTPGGASFDSTIPATVGSATKNYFSNGNAASTGAFAANSLKITNNGSGGAFTGTGTLTITAASGTSLGGILFDNSNGVGSISGYTGITTSTANQEIIIYTGGSTPTNAFTVNSPLTNGTGSFTKNGTGTLVLGGNSTFTGNAVINEGTVRLSGVSTTIGVNSTAGNVTTVRQGATLNTNFESGRTVLNVGALQGAGVITNSGSSTAGTISLGRSTSTGTSIFSGVLQDGAGLLSVTVDGTTARTQALMGLSSYTGVTTIATGAQLTVDVLADGGTASGIGQSSNVAGNLVFNGTAPQLIYRGNIRDGSLNLGSASATTDRLFTLSGSGATLSSTVINGNAIEWRNTGSIVHGTNADRTLTLSGTSTGDNTFNPLLSNSTGFVTSLAKTGAGQWNLGNSGNTYTGATTINEGILGLNNNTAINGNSPVVLSPTSATSPAILQTSGLFDRNLSLTPTPGTGSITWGFSIASTTGGAGFAAHTTPLTVAIGGVGAPTALTWGSNGFVGTGGVQNLVLGSSTALSTVDFRNAIDFGTSQRTVNVLDNTNTGADFATLSGVLSGSGAGGLQKIGGGILSLTGANTYTGVTDINAGTLIVSSLGNSADALNTPTSVGISGVTFGVGNAITIGNAGTGGGILSYVGAGETSDRRIRFNSTTGNPQIHADGAGPLILTNVANDMVAGVKGLFLRGTNTAGNMITSQLSDNGVTALSVTIDSNATWILTNNTNNYTGTTSVTAGGLGIGNNNAIGGGLITSTIINGNGNIFAYGADRTVANTLSLNNNANWGFVGDYNLNFSNPVVLNTSANSNSLLNSIVSGKALTFAGGMTANFLDSNVRTFTVDGPGETVINGNITTSTLFGLAVVKTGDGTLTLGASTASNFNQANQNIDLDRGRLRFTASNVIPSTAGSGGITISPEVLTLDTATLDLNGTSQSITSLLATTDGISVIDNTSATAASLTFGVGGATVNYGTGSGTYSITDSGPNTLSITKTGAGVATIGATTNLTYSGSTNANGGTFNINAALNGSPTINVSGAGTLLNLSAGLTTPTSLTTLNVGDGATFGLVGSTTDKLTGLSSLTLGSIGGTNTTLSFNVGDLTLPGDGGRTDTLTLAAGGTLNLFAGNKITFNLTSSNLNPNQNYVLLDATNIGGGFLSGPLTLSDYVLGITPSEFESFDLVNSNNNQIIVTSGNLAVGHFYTGPSTAWNSSPNNWADTKAGTNPQLAIPGVSDNVIFAANTLPAGPLVTTLEQDFTIKSLAFNSNTVTPANTPTSITINPGAPLTNTLTVLTGGPTEGVKIGVGGSPAVNIAAPFQLGSNQTWGVADAASALTFSGGLVGTGFDVMKTGLGRVSISAPAAATFNTTLDSDFTVNAGSLEFTNVGALGSTANNNLARIALNSGGAFFYNNAVSGTAENNLTLNGGTLSAGGNTQTYSGTVNVAANSFINMRDSNSAVVTTAARNITLSGVLSGNGSIRLDSNNTAAAGNQITGTLTISGSNPLWSGGMNVLRGTVVTANATGFGTGPINIEIGKVQLNGSNSETRSFNNNLSVSSATAISIGEFNLDNTSATVSAPFTVNYGGSITLGGVGGAGEMRVFLSDAANTVANFTGPVTLANNGAIHVRDNATLAVATFSGGIGESGPARSLTINGPVGGTAWGGTAGTLVLPVASTYSGGTNLVSGTVLLGDKAALGSGTVTVTGASTLQASAALSGANAIPNALTLNAALTVSGTNDLTVNGVTTATGANADRTLTNTLTGPATFTLAGNVNVGDSANTAARILTVAGTGATTISGNLLQGNAFANAVTVTNTGVTTFSGLNNTYSGVTTMNAAAGTLRLSGSNSTAGATTLTTGSIQLDNATNGGLASGTLTLTAGTLTPLNLARTISSNVLLTAATVSGTQNLTLSGTLTNNGVNGALTSNLTAPAKLIQSGSIFLSESITTGRTLTIAGAGNTDITGVISNASGGGVAGGLTKTGAGTLTLANTNTYSGVTTLSGASGVSAGVIAATANNALGTGNATLSFLTGTLGAQLTLSGGITLGNGVFTTTGVGSDGTTSGIIRSVSGANVISGNINMTGGGGASTYRADTGASLTVNGNVGGDTAQVSRIVSLVGGGDFVFNGTIRNSNDATASTVGVSSTNTGTTTLNGVNTYTLATTVGVGSTLIAGSTQAFGVNSATTVDGTLRLAGNNNSIGSLAGAVTGIVENAAAGPATLSTGGLNTSTAFSGVIRNGTGVGALSVAKTGTGTTTLSGTNTYTGTTSVGAGGALTAGSAQAFGVNSAATVNGTLRLAGNSNALGSLAGAGTGIVENANALASTLSAGGDNTSTTFSGLIQDGTGAGALSLAKNGSGALTLSGANTYTGGTTLNAGTIVVNTASSMGASSGALTVTGNSSVQLAAAFNTARNYVINAGVLTVDTQAFNQINSGTISGAGSLAKSGTGALTLSGTNTYTGTTSVGAGGALAAGSAQAFGVNSAATISGTLTLAGFSNALGSLAGTGTVENASGTAATLTVGGDNTSTVFSGLIRDQLAPGGGALSLVKTGTGTQTISGVNTFSGTTVVNGGTLLVNSVGGLGSSNVSLNGGILGGTGGVVTGGVTLDGGSITPGSSIGTLGVGSVNGTGSLGIEYNSSNGAIDLLNVAGALDISAITLNFSDLNGAPVPLTQPFYVFATYNSLVGSNFTSISGLPANYGVDYNYLSGSQIALVSAVPEPGTLALLAVVIVGGGLYRRSRNATKAPAQS